MNYCLFVLATISFMTNIVEAQEAANRTDLACIISLHIPQYPPLSQAARRSGTVRVIRTTADDEPASARVESLLPDL